MEDEQILDLYFARDEAAIAETDKKYRKLLLGVSKNVLFDVEDAKECVNDTYLRTWNKIPPERPAVFAAFLTRIVRGLAIDKIRKADALKRGGGEYNLSLDELGEVVEGKSSPEKEAESRELSAKISQFLREIKEIDRKLFVRRYFYMDSVKALAEFFEMNENTVVSRLKRTRDRLRVYLEKEGLV